MSEKFEDIDWSLTTWEGSRREQIRRWSKLTMDEILAAQGNGRSSASCDGLAKQQRAPLLRSRLTGELVKAKSS